jgi:GH15 family glucan-1,4-alpha-glucosidase
MNYKEPKLNLPLPSYDLWEENRGISTFTASAVYGGLQAASNFAKIFGDDRAENYQKAAAEFKEGIIKHLYDNNTSRFLKMLKPDGKGGYVKDRTIDSSVYGIFEFGVLPADNPMVEKTMKTVESHLWVKTDVGGIARYQNDYYHQVSKDIEKVPGNPWPICTMWLAEWYIAKDMLDEGRKILQLVVDHATESGILPEQIHPYNNQPLSVSPLTWSHSTFVLTVVEYLNKMNQLNICKQCGLPIHRRRESKLW